MVFRTDPNPILPHSGYIRLVSLPIKVCYRLNSSPSSSIIWIELLGVFYKYTPHSNFHGFRPKPPLVKQFYLQWRIIISLLIVQIHQMNKYRFVPFAPVILYLRRYLDIIIWFGYFIDKIKWQQLRKFCSFVVRFDDQIMYHQLTLLWWQNNFF